ncbi:MAG: hypothetical protein K0S11_1421, partial [Gammaproteobacteria bacterium]|nr:hypothetical protein [Gammaproteobacteria bacterium]
MLPELTRLLNPLFRIAYTTSEVILAIYARSQA